MNTLTWGREPLPKEADRMPIWVRFSGKPDTAFIATLLVFGEIFEWSDGDEGGPLDERFEWSGPISRPAEAPTVIAQERQAIIDRINAMPHFEMCALWRSAPSGHPYFDRSLPYGEVFQARLFGHFKGFTPAISKALTP